MTLRITRLAIISFLIAVPGVSAGGHGHGGGNVGVRGYYNGRGTHVSPHMRSAPDGNFWNNWSTYGNVNPYTGVPGTKRQNPNIGSIKISFITWFGLALITNSSLIAGLLGHQKHLRTTWDSLASHKYFVNPNLRSHG